LTPWSRPASARFKLTWALDHAQVPAWERRWLGIAGEADVFPRYPYDAEAMTRDDELDDAPG